MGTKKEISIQENEEDQVTAWYCQSLSLGTPSNLKQQFRAAGGNRVSVGGAKLDRRALGRARRDLDCPAGDGEPTEEFKQRKNQVRFAF